GGSYNDGGAFVFSVKDETLSCTDKFGRFINVTEQPQRRSESVEITSQSKDASQSDGAKASWSDRLKAEDVLKLFDSITLGNRHPALAHWSMNEIDALVNDLVALAQTDASRRRAVIDLLTVLHDRRYDTGANKRRLIIAHLNVALDAVFRSVTPISHEDRSSADRLIRWENRIAPIPGPFPVIDKGREQTPPLRSGGGREGVLFIDCTGFEPQGADSVGRLIVKANQLGWREFIVFACRGDRFIGCGLGANSDDVRIDVYGSSGDYLGSGLDGGEIQVHGDAQDQVGQILKRGKLVIHGMVGQTFLYGAKGGVAYVMDNAAGRPLINAVGSIRTIINGTALDYAAESFMAGATTGGGFLIINGVSFNDKGSIVPLIDRYPGGNFFSLASGGAGYINDPDWTLGYDQLNGGEIVGFEEADWNVIEPYLKENEKLFGIKLSDLLNGHEPNRAYRKVVPERSGEVKNLDAHT
ncbi:MAG TPA: glutamate synthase, partial [Anaerolineae bacterium]|nr:glutamate synthase [Anaerolineae bacterium]